MKITKQLHSDNLLFEIQLHEGKNCKSVSFCVFLFR